MKFWSSPFLFHWFYWFHRPHCSQLCLLSDVIAICASDACYLLVQMMSTRNSLATNKHFYSLNQRSHENDCIEQFSLLYFILFGILPPLLRSSLLSLLLSSYLFGFQSYLFPGAVTH